MFIVRSSILIVILSFAMVANAQSGNYCIENRFSETPMFDSSQIVVQKNVVYSVPKKWPGTGVDTLKLDMYYPNSTADALASRPCVVFFYGGAWLLGSKEDAGIKQKCFDWARRGFVVAAPNYRLGWNCAATDLFAVCVLCQGVYYNLNTAVYRGAQDGKAAMRWIVNNKNTYKIDTSALFVGGESAGSYNALHTAYWDHKYAKKVFNGTPYSILGSIDSAGAYPGTPFRIKAVINACGAVVSDTGLHFKRIPMVAFHDQADCVVPYQTNQTLNCCATSFFWAKGSKDIYTALTNAGIPTELHTVPGVTQQHCSYPSATLVKESSCFVKKILCGLSPSGSTNFPAVPAISCNSLKSLRMQVYDATDIVVYPVPASDKIRVSGNSLNRILKINLMEMHGRIISSFEISKGLEKYEINIADLPNGIYDLQFVDEIGYRKAKRFVVLR